MRKLFTKTSALIALTILIVIQFVLLGIQWHQQKNTNNSHNDQLSSLEGQVVSANNGLSYQPVTVSPSDKKIYLPQLNLALPLTALGTSLVYSPDTAYVTGSYQIPAIGPLDEAAISTFSTAGAPQSQTQFNCSELVRIEFGAKPDPLNHSEVAAGSVQLANGKTLQIYASHLKNCQKEWTMTQANADAIAALFKQAQSY